MDPVSFIIETMRRAKEARLCAPPRLWKDLLGYHQIGEGMMNPKTGSSLDVITTFSQFDNESFPCMKSDQEYGGLGSTFAVLERAAAIDHALRSDPFPGLSNCDTMDCPCMTNDGDPTSQCSMSLPGFIPHVWSRVAADLPHFEHDSWIANDPTAWESEHFRPMVPYTCSCGEGFETMVRLQWHVNQAHPPGSQHSASLGLLPRTGGSYILYDPLTRAVCLCGLARFPISGGNKPSSTCAEACTIFLALFHARRTLHPDNSYSTLTDSLSSV